MTTHYYNTTTDMWYYTTVVVLQLIHKPLNTFKYHNGIKVP